MLDCMEEAMRGKDGVVSGQVTAMADECRFDAVLTESLPCLCTDGVKSVGCKEHQNKPDEHKAISYVKLPIKQKRIKVNVDGFLKGDK